MPRDSVGESATPVEEFLDDSDDPAGAANTPPWQRLLAAILSPVALNAMLSVGGGLGVLGAIIWLASLGVFDDPRVLAASMIAGSLAVIGIGVATSKRTRFQIAGTATTFLGCVLLPLNLWFLQAQQLLVIEDGLWMGALLCTGVYCVVFMLLRNPVLIYAVEIGATLTLTLLLGALGLWTHVAGLSLMLVGLGLLSLHATWLATESDESPRGYAQPLWISGHVQLDLGVILLFAWQATYFLPPLSEWAFGWSAAPQWTTDARWLTSLVWLLAAYGFAFTALRQRAQAAFWSVAAACLLAAVATLATPYLSFERTALLVAAFAAATQYLARRAQQQQNQWGQSAAGTLAAIVAAGLLTNVLEIDGPRLPVVRSIGDLETWLYPLGTILLIQLAAWYGMTVHRAGGVISALAGLWSLSLFVGHWPRVVASTDLFTSTTWITLALALMTLAGRWQLGDAKAWWCRLHAGYALLPAALALLSAMVEHQLGLSDSERFWRGGTLVGGGLAALAAAFLLKGKAEAWLGSFGVVTGSLIMLEAFDVPLEYSLLAVALLSTIGIALFPTGRAADDGDPVEEGSLGLVNIARMSLVICGLTTLFRIAGPWVADRLELMHIAVTAALAALFLTAAVLSEQAFHRKGFVFGGLLLAVVSMLSGLRYLDLTAWQVMEVICALVGCLVYGMASLTATWERSQSERRDEVTVSLWLGCLLAIVPLFFTAVWHRSGGHELAFEEVLLVILSAGLLVSGIAWQIKSSTAIGGLALVGYLAVLIRQIVETPQLTVGVWLSIFGGSVFLIGLLLSLFRDRLARIPQQAANQEGIFQYMKWR